MMSVAWTDLRDAQLSKLWKEGLSASQIAKQMRGFAHCADGGRNAVIGRAHRLGLRPRRDIPLGGRGKHSLLQNERQERQFHAMWLNPSIPSQQIADQFGANYKSLWKMARRLGLPLRQEIGRGPGGYTRAVG